MTRAELDAIVDAARARQADITPAPWEWGGETDEEQIVHQYPYTAVALIEFTDFGYMLAVPNQPDQDLITDAPRLNAAVIALNDQINGKDAIIAQLLAHNETLQQIARSYTTGGRIAGVEKMIEGGND